MQRDGPPLAVYAFYIFDRHTECIYTKRWAPATVPGSAQAASVGAVATNATGANASQRSSLLNNPANGVINPAAAARAQAKASDDAKLIFGAIFSLRRLVQQLGGADDAFLSYRTGEYKLHYFETPTQLKFILLTDTRTGSMRTVLHQIWATLYVEYVVKSPLSPIEHTGGKGVANELFEGGLETFMASIFHIPQPPIMQHA